MPPSPKLLFKKMWKMPWSKSGHSSAAPDDADADADDSAVPRHVDIDNSSHMPATPPIHGSRIFPERSYTWSHSSGYKPTNPLSRDPASSRPPLVQVGSSYASHAGSSISSSTMASQAAIAPPSAPHKSCVKRKDSFVSATGRMADATGLPSENGKVDFLSCLPYEIAVVVVIYADFPTITTIAEVCRSWRRFARDNAVWRRLFLQQAEWRTPRALAAAGCRSSGARKNAQHGSHSQSIAASPNTCTSALNTPRIGDEDTAAMNQAARASGLGALPMRSILSAYSGSSLGPAIALQHMIAPSPTLSTVGEPGGRLVGADWRYLFQQRLELDRHWERGIADVHTITGHADSVYCVQYDSDKIVTGSRDRTIKVWNSTTLRCMRTLTGHDASVLCLKYDNRILVTGSSDSTIIIWNWEAGAPQLRLVSHTAGVLDVAFDDEHIVSCSKDCTIKVWQRSNGKLLRTMVGHRGPVNAVQLRGGRIVSASGDSLIKMWDLKTGELIRNFAGHTRGLACVQFDGKTIVSGSSDQLIKVWDAESGRCTQTLRGHKDLVRTLHFAGGRRAVSGSYDQTVKVWDIVSGKCMLDLKEAHTSWVFDVQFSTSRIVSTSQDQKIIIWDFAKGLDVSDID